MGSTLWADPAGLNNLMGSSCVLGPVFDFTVPGVLPLGATFARASKATLFDGTGTLQEVADNVPAWTYDPATLALQGPNDEELRTNEVRNPRLEGGVSGSPGTLPTNFSSFGQGSLIRTLAFGTEDGMSYMDIGFSGTTSTTNVSLIFEPSTQISALTGQAWSNACNVSRPAGSFSNILSAALILSENTSGGAFVTSQNVSIATATSAALRTQRFVKQQTLNGGITTAFVSPYIQLFFSSGVVIGITLRLAVPQPEMGTGASSIILPPVGAPAAATRSVAVVQLALANGTYNFDIYRASGLTSLTNVVVSGGSYPVPTDLSPLRLVIPKRIA